jgi:hypothetical protein
MTDPQRLLEESGDDFERALLRSSRIDEPGPRAAASVAAAIGVGSAIVSGASTASGIGATAGVTAGKAGAWVVAKWVGFGIVAGGVTVAGLQLARTASKGSPVEHAEHAAERGVLAPPPAAQPLGPDTRAAEVAPTATAPEPASVHAQPERARGVEAVRQPAHAPAAPAEASAARFDDVAAPVASAPRTSPVSIAGEVSALDRARTAIAARKPAEALAALDEYERGGSRMLAQEAAVLRVEALLLAGNRAGAAALARRLVEAEPQSPHAPRWREIAGQQNP